MHRDSKLDRRVVLQSVRGFDGAGGSHAVAGNHDVVRVDLLVKEAGLVRVHSPRVLDGLDKVLAVSVGCQRVFVLLGALDEGKDDNGAVASNVRE